MDDLSLDDAHYLCSDKNCHFIIWGCWSIKQNIKLSLVADLHDRWATSYQSLYTEARRSSDFIFHVYYCITDVSLLEAVMLYLDGYIYFSHLRGE